MVLRFSRCSYRVHRPGARCREAGKVAALYGSRVMPDAASAGAIASAPGEPTPAQPALSRGAIVGRALVLVGLLVFVFGIVLPRVVDYDAVRAALAALTPGQIALLGAASAVAYVASAGPTRVLVPGLSWPHAVGSDLAARAVVSTVPGPTDVATRLVLYRQWSIPTAVASAGIALAALFETFSYFALPLIAAAGLLVSRQPTDSRALLLALIGLVVLVAATLLLVSIVRSESLARKLGGWLDGMARRIWKLFRKTPPTGIVEGMLDLRERSKTILTQHGLRGFAAAVVARLAWFVVLERSPLVRRGRARCPPAVGRAGGDGGRRHRVAGAHHAGRRGRRRGRLHRHPVERGPGDDRAAHRRRDVVPDRPVVHPDPGRVGAPARDAVGPPGRVARRPWHGPDAALELRESASVAGGDFRRGPADCSSR